ncbi:hypothetical protein SANA_13720 [Gottschalkiaceae bacterium SANA]|nr:hypothetical protein SANA_13720 [Gottschalkiaceae bacterium SANA]
MSRLLKIGILYGIMMIILENGFYLFGWISPELLANFDQFIMILIPAVLLALITRTDLKERFKLKGFKPSTLLYIFALFLALLPISGFLSGLTTYLVGVNPNGVDAYIDAMETSLFMKWFLIAITPAICEEIMFRGLLLDKRIGLNMHVLALMSGLMFSLFHVGYDQLLYTFPLGLVFAYVSIISGSIFPAMIMHLMNNSLGIFAEVIGSGVEEVAVEEAISLGSLLPLFIAACFGIIVIVLVLKRMIKSYKYDDKLRLAKNGKDAALYRKEKKILTFMPQVIVLIYVWMMNAFLLMGA